jgi:hypothetical protein
MATFVFSNIFVKIVNSDNYLRQGNPMLFILVIDPLHRLIELAASRGILHPILPRATSCSLYADDAAIFANRIVPSLITSTKS